MLTLNIIEHELCSVGRVVRTCSSNPSFSAFRLFIEPTSLAGPDTLYLCGTRDDVGKAVSQNCQALYVSAEDDSPDERAVLSVLEGESILVVFNALLDAIYRFADWERLMDDVRFRGGGLQELLDISSTFLQNNVVIVDPALKLLAYTKDVPCDDPITVELITHGYHTEENINKFKLHKRFKPWAEEDGFIINKKKKALLWVASGKKNANIPSGVKTVIRRAFTNSTATSVNIPKTVKTIEKDGLTSIYINKVFVSKNSRYFARKGQCVYDKKHHALSVAVTRNDGILCIADKVRRLQSDNSIAGHDVDTLIVPSSVRSSTGTGFNLERLGLLDEVYFLGKKPPKIVKAAPSGYHSLPVFCKVYVPKGCKKTYINWYMKNKCYDDIKSLTEMSDKKRTELIRIAASNTVKEPSKKKTKIAGSNTGTSSTDSQR